MMTSVSAAATRASGAALMKTFVMLENVRKCGVRAASTAHRAATITRSRRTSRWRR
jgi:hypothetical protein